MEDRIEELKQELFDCTIDGLAGDVRRLTEEGLSLGIPPLELLDEALVPALREVGRMFEVGEAFVPEMLIAAKAMQAAMVVLKPLLVQTGARPIGKIVMMTVKGDIHDIGKNLVAMMLQGAAFEVIDLGVNTPPEKLLEIVEQHEPDFVGISALLTTTMPMMKVTIEALQKAGLRDRVQVLLGGAPVTDVYAETVGADGYAPDASSAVRLAQQLLATAIIEPTG